MAVLEENIYITSNGEEWLESELLSEAEANDITLEALIGANDLTLKEEAEDVETEEVYINSKGEEWSIDELTSTAEDNNVSLDDLLGANDLTLKGGEKVVEEEVVEEVEEVEEVDVDEFLVDDPEAKLETDLKFFENFEGDYEEAMSTEWFGGVGSVEEKIVPELSDKFSKYGFTFEESGAGDYVTVRTVSSDPSKIKEKEFSVGNFGSVDNEGLNEMKAWIQENKKEGVIEYAGNTDFDIKKALREMATSKTKKISELTDKDIQEEADNNPILENYKKIIFASEGLDYEEFKEVQSTAEYIDEELAFINKVQGTIGNVEAATVGKIAESAIVANLPWLPTSVAKFIGGTLEDTGKKFNENPWDIPFMGEDLGGVGSYEELKPFVEAAKKTHPHLFDENGKLKLKYFDAYKEKLSETQTYYSKLLQGEENVAAKIEAKSNEVIKEAALESQEEIVVTNKAISDQAKITREDISIKTGGVELEEYMQGYDVAQKDIDNRLKNITNGVGFDGLNKYKAKSEEEVNQINALITESQELYNTKAAPINIELSKLQALSTRQAALNQKANDLSLIMNFGDVERVRGEYVEGALYGLLNDAKKGWSQGVVNEEFVKLAYGINDMSDP